ncbi:MAG TPA: hypothetical protein VGD98_10355 [Ktedonobacteraceae bacterium]
MVSARPWRAETTLAKRAETRALRCKERSRDADRACFARRSMGWQ